MYRTVLLGRAVIFGHDSNYGLQDGPRVGCPCGEGGDGREKPTSQLHTFLDGEAIEEIKDVLEWGVGRLGGDHQVRVCGIGGRGFDTRSCLLFGLTVAGLVAAVDFSLGFLGPAVFLVAVSLGCVGVSVTG